MNDNKHDDNSNNVNLLSSESSESINGKQLFDKLFYSATSENNIPNENYSTTSESALSSKIRNKKNIDNNFSATSENSVRSGSYSATSDNLMSIIGSAKKQRKNTNAISNPFMNTQSTKEININSDEVFKKYSSKNEIIGGGDKTRKIEIHNLNNLRNLFVSQNNISNENANINYSEHNIPKNINELADKLKTMSSRPSLSASRTPSLTHAHIAQENSLKVGSDNKIESLSSAKNDSDDSIQIGGGGNPEIFKENVRLSKHIAEKSNVKYKDALKVTKYYRDKVKNAGSVTDVVEQYKEAYKLYDKDLASGNAESVVSKLVKKQGRITTKNKLNNNQKNAESLAKSSSSSDESF